MRIQTTYREKRGQTIFLLSQCIPDLSADIHALMYSMKEHKVYELVNGQVLDSDNPPAKDVISFRLQQLTDSAKNPLTDYNKAFT